MMSTTAQFAGKPIHFLPKFLLAVTLILIIIISTNIDICDLDICFHPASVELLHARNPYRVPGVFNPLYALVLLSPLGLLKIQAANFIYPLIILGTLILVCKYYKFSYLEMLLFFLSYPVFWAIFYGNVDWLVVLSFIPGPWSFPLALVKPQMGIGYAIYLALSGKHRRIIILTLLIVVLSFFLGSNWKHAMIAHQDDGHNYSIWPWGLLIGIPALGLSIRLKEPALAWLAGPFLSPYVLVYSYSGAVFSIIVLWRRHEQVKQEVIRVLRGVCSWGRKVHGVSTADYQTTAGTR